jgi:SH3 domain protein
MKFSLKCFGWIGIFLVLLATAVCGETMYVSDNLKLTLRTGPSTENKILAVIESGQMLETVEYGKEWSRVQLPNGKEGWVLSRYLTSNETNNIKLERLQAKHKNLMAQAAALLEENTQLKTENKKLNTGFEDNQNQLGTLRNDYETLKAEAGEFLTLKSEYESASSQLVEQTQKAEKLEKQLTKLELNF